MSEPPLTIWILNHYSIPASEAGGSRHYALAKQLIARGHRVFLIASCRNYQAPDLSRLAPHESWRLEEIEGVPFLWLKTVSYRANGISRLLNMLSYSMRVLLGPALDSLPRPDVIIGSSPHPFAALAAQRVAARRGVPFLLEVRDLWPQSLVDVGGLSRAHPLVVLLAAIERFLYRRADAVISLLPGAGEHITAVAGRDVTIVWVPNGVDLSMVTWPNEAADSRWFTLMYAGAHGRANGLDVVLDAASILERRGESKGLRIRLVGDGPEKPRLRERAKELDLEWVTFEDPIAKVEIYARLAQADGFLMLLKDSPVFKWGVSPNKLFDYMSTGRPVIFGVSTPYNPVALSRAGLTIAPDDPSALADAILALRYATAEARAEMGLRGRAYVLENHGFDQLATRIERTCRNAIQSKPPLRYEAGATDPPDGLKRAFDLVLGAIALVVASPIMLVVALAIRVTMGSPVLFRQKRAGFGGHPFAIFKFRTMRQSTTPDWDPGNDTQRLTALGRSLRRWSLDEFPQLFNVLKGDMSLVGPRPLPIEYNPRYSAEQARRLRARPGITGWAQVNGRNALDWESRFLLDTWYVDHRSLMLDLRILWRTAAQVLRGRGISAAGSATMTEFTGVPENDLGTRAKARDIVA